VQRRRRWQWVVATIVAGLLFVWWTLRRVAEALLDRWWYETITDADVWSTRLGAQLQLAAAAGIVTAVVLGSSVIVGLGRAQPPADVAAPVRRYRERIGPAHRWLLVAAVVALTLRIAVSAMGHWQSWLLFRHGGPLDTDVPELGPDLGYFLFDLPLLTVASSWVRQLLLVALVVAAFAHLASGNLRLPRGENRSTPMAVGHLALLGALLAGAQTLHYVFVRRPSLALARSGSFDGAGYTEVRVDQPSTWVLAAVALIVGFLLVDAIRSGRWRLAVVSVGVWAVLHVALVAAVPALVERFVVEPAEATRQLPYIGHHLAATEAAYRLDAVDTTSIPLVDGVSAPLDAAVQDDLARVPVFEADQLVDALQVLQGETAVRISDVDLDRYEIDGTRRPVMVAARDLDRADLPEQGWVQSHLVYTHGKGVVAVPADQPGADGRPDVDALATTIVPARDELYFGDDLGGWYAIVGTERAEQDGTAFEADTGIEMSSFWRRAVLALAVGDVEPVLTAELTDESQLLYRRDVRDRVRAAAPFLGVDGDPYPVVTADGVVWVMDAYTTSSTYPYAQRVGTDGLPPASDLHGGLNYVHGSVKATVDAYDGSVHLYRTAVGGADDPILDAWVEIFPGLFEPIDAMPAELRDHLRYPTELMTIQTDLLGRYHVDDPETFFSGADRWAVASAPSDGVGQPGSGPAPAVSVFMPGGGDLGGAWVSIRPYRPGAASNPSSTRDELIAYAVADNDDAERLRLFVVEGGVGRQVATPTVAQSAIDADPALARIFEGLDANGSQVAFGPMTPLPIDESMVWARSVIVSGTNAATIPRLYGVAGVSRGTVALTDDVATAVATAAGAG